MVAPKQQFPLVRWAVLVCSYDDLGTRAHAGRVTQEPSPFNSAQSLTRETMNEEKPEYVRPTVTSWRQCKPHCFDAVAELVGIEGGVVSGVINLESSGVEASDWRPRHDEQYNEA
jgi:hypothetical protein